jgi:hypothetical protein
MGKFIKDYFKNDLKKSLERQEKARNLIERYEETSIDDIPLLDAISISGSGTFSPQKRTGFIEDKMRRLFSWKKVKASEAKGDYIDKDGKYFELKCSSTNDFNLINLLQIRPWQEVDYYRVIYFDLDEPRKSKSYILSKNEMIAEIEKYGAATHGTKNTNKSNGKIEYSIHLPIENEWDKQFLDEDFFKER